LLGWGKGFLGNELMLQDGEIGLRGITSPALTPPYAFA
jgi:hypothetical protein